MASSIDPPRPPLAPAVRVLAEAALQRQNWLLAAPAAPTPAGAAPAGSAPTDAPPVPFSPNLLPPALPPMPAVPAGRERVSLSDQARQGLQAMAGGAVAPSRAPAASHGPAALSADAVADEGASARAAAIPAPWPAQGVGAPLLRLLNTLVQQLGPAGGAAPRVLAAQPWPAGTDPAAGGTGLPALQIARVAQGMVYTPDGARGFTLTLRLPAAAMPALPSAPTAPAALSVGFAGPPQALAPGLFALVLQGPGAAGQRTSGWLSLDLAPAPGAAAVVYGRDPLQARTDPWLALAALQASGQSRVQEHDRAAEPPCSAPGCPYEGRAPCVQPFCLALRVQPAPLAAPTGPG